MFKKIKSLFIVEEEGTSAQEDIPSKSNHSGQSQPSSDNTAGSSPLHVSKKGVDKFINLLLKALEEPQKSTKF